MSDPVQTGRTIPVAIEDEVKESYLNYAMSVIVSRALPDVRDGLKPVHRRILFAMNEMGLRHDRPYKKSARIVGDVLGKFHPHGDQSIYDALVRMAQDFSMRYPVVDGQGNFGSVDGDTPAAMRYTEARMARIAEEMLRDINKDTVDFGPNYDDSDEEPLVLPAAFPYLLANGASGIAVGMATNIPPHNLVEISNAVAAYIDNPDVSIDALMKHVSGPDFPTGGTIYGTRGINAAFRTGRGRITVRARFSLEENAKGRDVILVTELPYMVNKAVLITRIADLVRDRKLDGIADLRDESDRKGMRIVIELKRGYSPKVIINQLFMHTQMQVNFNVNALALVDGRPKVLTLKDMIQAFVEHRKEVVTRRTQFDLKKAEDREHILEGLKIALDNIDEVIKTIRESEDVETARAALMGKFSLSERQAQAILDMRLQKLTSLETQKIIEELEQVRALIRELRELLANEAKLLGLIKRETLELAEKFGDERATEIDPHEVEAIDIEDLIQKEDMVVVISHRGFIKRVRYSSYRVQGRGGRGSSSSGNLREDDFIEHLFIGSTHDHIMFFTNLGQAYYLKIHEIPEGSKQAKGVHVKTLLAIAPDEDVASVLTLKEFDPEVHLLFATARGQLIRVRSSDFVNAKTRGIRAVKLTDGDTLKSVFSITDADQVFMASRRGQGLRIQASDVRLTGRGSKGVRGLVVKAQDEVAGATPAPEGANVLLLSERGYGKRVEYGEFRIHGRATQGMRAYSVTEDTGEVVSALTVNENDEVMVITSHGLTIKLRAGDVSKFGRTARGVFVINIHPPDFVVGLAKVQESEGDDEENGGDGPESGGAGDEDVHSEREVSSRGNADDEPGDYDEAEQPDSGSDED